MRYGSDPDVSGQCRCSQVPFASSHGDGRDAASSYFRFRAVQRNAGDVRGLAVRIATLRFSSKTGSSLFCAAKEATKSIAGG